MLIEAIFLAGAYIGGLITGYNLLTAAPVSKTKTDDNCPIDVDYFIGLIKNGTVEYYRYKIKSTSYFQMRTPDGKLQFSVADENSQFAEQEGSNFYLHIDGTNTYHILNLDMRKRILSEMNKSQRASITNKITELQLQQAKDFIDKHTKEEAVNKKL